MAQEILVLETYPTGEGNEDYMVLVFYEIDPLITVEDQNGVPVVAKPTPSSQLPQMVDDFNLVPQTYKNRLDDGSAMFETFRLRRKEGESIPAIVQRIRERYSARAAVIVGAWRQKYSRTGTWVDV